MEPRTIRQKEVFALSQKLKPLTLKQECWLAKKEFKGVGVIENQRVWCLECNSISRVKDNLQKVSHCKCPICGKKLELTSGGVKRKFVSYGAKLQVVGNYQVIREFTITHRHTSWSVDENMQSWISEDGKETIIARPLKFMPRYIDDWDFNKDMSIRQVYYDSYWHDRYQICGYTIMPRPRLQSWIERAGYKIAKQPISLNKLFQCILTNPKYETLLKAGKNEAIKFFSKTYRHIDAFWPQIKICLRNNYEPYDWSIYCDYINSLVALGIDTHNAKFVCPADLKAAHDKVMEKLDRIRAKKRLERQMKEIAEAEVVFAEKIKPFLTLCIKKDNCTIAPLKSVKEFFEEGVAMHHCVFTNGYYKKNGCLILSAKIDGKRAETIEVNLHNREIVQSRGKNNQNSKYHDYIVSLVNKNMGKICRCS